MKNQQKSFIIPLLIGIIVVLAIGTGVYVYQNKKAEIKNTPADTETNSTTNTQVSTSQNTSANPVKTTQSPQTTTITTNTNFQASIDAKTVDWKRYDSGRGFEFKYPTYFSLDNSSAADNIVLTYDQGGTNYFSVNIKNSTQSLEQDVQAIVATEKADSAQAAAPVTVTSKSYTVGNSKVYLILSQAGDVPNSTSAMFKTKDGNNIVTFHYSYQGYILMKNPSDVTGGAPVTADFQNELQAKLKAYNDIQTIISTFRFFH